MKKRLILILLLVAVVAVAASAAFAVTVADAEENDILVVHFYNGSPNEKGELYDFKAWGPDQRDVSWGAYYWIDIGKVSMDVTDDFSFAPDTEGNTNHGIQFTIHFTASEAKAIKAGKKLGLIMVRTYKDELGYWTPYWNSNKGKDLSADRYISVDLSNGRGDIWIIAGDKNNYTTEESAKLAFQRIESANFFDFNRLVMQTTAPVTVNDPIEIYQITDHVNKIDSEWTTPLVTVKASWVSSDGLHSRVDGLGLDKREYKVWPGEELTAESDRYQYTFSYRYNRIIFTNGAEGDAAEQTMDIAFADGATYAVGRKTGNKYAVELNQTATVAASGSREQRTVTFVKPAGWDKVYAYVYGTFDWNADYQIHIGAVSPFNVTANKTRLYLSDEFKSECELPADMEQTLGVTYTPEATTFRVWAPVSTNVQVNFYGTGDELDPDRVRPSEDMHRIANGYGVWELTVKKTDSDPTSDLNGVYYTYSNWLEDEPYETVDVYATAVGVNGTRSMVCDLDATDPNGWEEDLARAQTIRETKSDIGVIWEVHVRDFSISPDSGLTYQGKYLAFTEQNTHVKGSDTLLSGIAYLKDLGVSYVHLNPVFDFATVDEQYINNTDYTTKQNWGYDPKNYNVPEGSYATDAEHGEVRINEFKQMVMALHEAGIGVIMDVVYNHTATADSYLEKTVPGYYYRQQLFNWSDDALNQELSSMYGAASFNTPYWTVNGLGVYNLSDGSGCSNETASERAMFRRYMVDSLVYWASEYHIDGFRFDLMKIHDIKTMQSIRMALNELPGGMGILLYGEPWAAADLGLNYNENDPSYIPADYNSLWRNEMLGIRVFNQEIRNGIKGDNGWAGVPGKGYVQGYTGDSERTKITDGIKGKITSYSGAGNDHAVNYTSSHDNYTLWDQLIVTTVTNRSPTLFTEPNNVLIRKAIMAEALVLTSRGIAFLLAGDEMGRTKYGNHNSYNAQDKINAIDYNRQKEFSLLHDWVKGLIKLRTSFKGIAKGNVNDEDIYVANENCLCYVFYAESGDAYNRVYVLTNPNGGSRTFSIQGEWRILADGTGFHEGNKQSVSGSVTLPAYGTYILVQ